MRVNGTREEQLLETGPGQHDVQGEPGGAMLERHDARGFDERVSAVDAQGEAARFQRPDEVTGGHAALHGDVHVRRQSRTSPHQCGLAVEDEPAAADGVERQRQIGQKFSAAGRRRHATPPRPADGRARRRGAAEAWATRRVFDVATADQSRLTNCRRASRSKRRSYHPAQRNLGVTP
jgi:hypothetical protein